MTDERERYAPVIDSISKTGLPVSFDRLPQAARAVIPVLSEAMGREGRPISEIAEYLDLLWSEWKETGKPERPSRILERATDAILGADDAVDFLCGQYFRIFHKLIDSCFLSAQQASALLGDARLIRVMVMREHMSVSRVRRVLNLDASTPYSAIQAIMAAFDGTPELTVDDVHDIIERDRLSMDRLFKDDDIDHSFATIRTIAFGVCGANTIADDLQMIYESGFDPCYGILHYEMLSVDKYDRCPGDAVYEFSPRGKAITPVWRMYRSNTSNPYLNNGKAVQYINAAWAGSRIVSSKF